MTVTFTVRPTDGRTDDPELDDLRALAEIKRAAEAKIEELTPRVHDLHTWTEIGDALGLTHEQARRHYSPRGRAAMAANAAQNKARYAAMRRSHEILTKVLTEGGHLPAS